MSWYEREEMAKSRERDLERHVDYRRLTSEASRPRRPVHFWLIAILRNWLIGVAR